MADLALSTKIVWHGDALDKAHLKAVQGELRSIGSDMTRELRAMLRARKARKAGASPAGQVPAMVTGELAKAVTRDNRGLRKKRPWVRVGIDFKEAPYAGVLEFGGVIEAKKNSLMIPLNEEARQMQERNAVGQEMAAGRLAVIPGKGGRRWIVKRAPTPAVKGDETVKPKRPPNEFLFLLAKSIRIPAHPFIRPLSAKMRPVILSRIASAAGQAVNTFSPTSGGSVTEW